MSMSIRLCPYCESEISQTAKKCRHCGEWLEERPTTGVTSLQNPETMLRQALGDKYEVLDIVGKGGMATVYKAVQKSLGRTVALKVVHQNLVHDQEFVQRFLREAQVSASLSHPNIVTVHDVGSVGPVHYMAMEFLEGNDLHQMVKANGALPQESVVKWTIPIAEALDYIHSQNLLHRDIKASNILITKDGRPVLMDFGIAHAADGTKLTQTGTVIGTPEYMSPEQAQGKSLDHCSDLYSLGVVMYECLTGKVPFKGDNPLTTIHLLTNTDPETLGSLNKKVPNWLNTIVLKLLAKEPPQRFKDGKELSGALKAKKGVRFETTTAASSSEEKVQNTGQVKKQSEKSKPPKVLPWLIVLVALVTIVFAGKYFYDQNGKVQAEITTRTEQVVVTNKSQPGVSAENKKKKVTTEDLQKAGEYEKAGDYQMGKKEYSAALDNYNKALALLPGNPLFTAKKDDAESAIKQQQDEEKRKAEEAARKERERKATEERRQERERLAKERQRQEAARKQAILDKYGMVLVQGGSFQMGSTSSYADGDEQSMHMVTLSSFYISKFELTKSLWQEIMGSNPSRLKGNQNPVEQVSWNDVQDFLRKLNQKTDMDFRLPTEAEWEFAARGGNKSKGYTYSGGNSISDVGWYGDNSDGKKPVGKKEPNELGLYDMSGNVYEWCSDWYDSGYYNSSETQNPKGPSLGSERVARGGSWISIARCCRVAYRYYNGPDDRDYYVGFRLAYSSNGY